MKSTEMNAAYLIERISAIRGENPGKKTVQKLVYLIQANGIDCGYEYGIHFYGPYSSVLDMQTMVLSASNIISFDYSSFAHRMHVNSIDEIQSSFDPSQREEIDAVITKFKEKSASQLELLTTAHYVFTNTVSCNHQQIIDGVEKIKGTKYSETQIKQAIEELNI